MNVDVKFLAAPMVDKVRIIEWLKEEGDYIQKGDVLVRVETSKVTADVKSPYDGVLTRILYDDNTELDVNEIIAVIEKDINHRTYLV